MAQNKMAQNKMAQNKMALKNWFQEILFRIKWLRTKHFETGLIKHVRKYVFFIIMYLPGTI